MINRRWISANSETGGELLERQRTEKADFQCGSLSAGTMGTALGDFSEGDTAESG